MSESKGISLRRKKTTRPKISAPRQISQPREPSVDSRWETQTIASSNTNLSLPPAEARRRPSAAGASGASTSDLVKRRYSTRFTGQQAPNWQDGALAPPMPSLPAQYAGGAGGRGRSTSPVKDGRSPGPGESKLRVDARALKDPNLQAEKYAQTVLADATENDIHAYQNELQSIKTHASTDLQHNVYQNRTQFIKISKEADKLKSEMRTLRTLMSELTSALGHATSAGGAELTNGNTMSAADRKRANRSSVANLEAMWSTHLQVLWKRVEGSQKFLPALPGRHIIMESQRWVELNAATWKPRRRVALVLLNDHLLIASEKKRNDLLPNENDSKSKRQSMYQTPAGQASRTVHVAERCWALQDVSLADISTSGDAERPSHHSRKEHAAMKNAINIRAGSESFTYATPDGAEKTGMIVAFRKAQEDLRKQVAAEHAKRGADINELALLTGKDPKLLKKAVAAEAAEDAKKPGGLSRSGSILMDAEGRQQSIRSVEASIDALDIDIALQRFEDAVSKVEKLRRLARSVRSNVTASEIISAKVDERANRLAASIGRQLVLSSSGMERTKTNVSWLLRLGFEEMARTRYLDSRAETIRVRARGLPFTGALPPYLHALAFATFHLMLHTVRTFSGSFPPASGSAVVRWAKERVDEFNEILERQLSSVGRGTALWNECIEVVKTQAGVLGEVGVDFRGLVARGLVDDHDPETDGKRERSKSRRRANGDGGGNGGANEEGVGLGVST